MTRLIDADALKDWSEIVPLTEDGGIDINDFDEKLMSMPTVDAVPVSYIQQRIDRLRLLAEYEFEANGGYVGKVHTEVYALRALINYWKAERNKHD